MQPFEYVYCILIYYVFNIQWQNFSCIHDATNFSSKGTLSRQKKFDDTKLRGQSEAINREAYNGQKKNDNKTNNDPHNTTPTTKHPPIPGPLKLEDEGRKSYVESAPSHKNTDALYVN